MNLKQMRWGVLLLLLPFFGTAQKKDKPNIIVIWGDDIGRDNISAYHRGMMGGSTPNIDRIAQEGAIFTDSYAQQSCTAGRAAFITGQHSFRTGLLTIGMPGAKQGIHKDDPTIAELLKPLGYKTAQIGKNHLGDRNEYLPTVHGFDYFYGNLYHLNAEEEPEDPQYPKDPKFHETFGPRGVLECTAVTTMDKTNQPRWGTVGKQRIKDTGPLNRERMKTVEEDLLSRSLNFIQESADENKPFFLWHNSTRNHVWIHNNPKFDNSTGYGVYADGMAELDWVVGEIYKKLEETGQLDNTIIVFSTDNGAETFSWPEGGMMPFHGEKGSTWEGGFRVPQMVRWPGKIPAGTVVNDIFSHEDWMPTLLAAAGEESVKEKLLTGYRGFKAHLDGYNQLPLLMGQEEKGNGPRKEIYYFDAGGHLNAIRYGDWKIIFTMQEGAIWEAYRKTPSWPKVVNLRMDPYEKAPFESLMYLRWMADKMWAYVPAQAKVTQFLGSFKDFPPRAGSSLSVDAVLEKMRTAQRN
ncbi:MAG: arylsulfatase [Flavobacteriaceae bacterium]